MPATRDSSPEIDWGSLVPEPRWESLLESEQIRSLGHGHDFARAREVFARIVHVACVAAALQQKNAANG